MRCLYREHRYICGQYMEVEHYPVFTSHIRRRGPKRKPTSETMKRHNDIVAKRKLIRLAHTNFTPDDIRFDLTYNAQNYPESAEAAQKQMQLFLRRLRRYRKKNDLHRCLLDVYLESGNRKMLRRTLSVYDNECKAYGFPDTVFPEIREYLGKQ